MILVSACLAGINCRYDGESKSNQKIIDMVKSGEAIPVCPEMLGGLGIPRKRAEIRGNKVINQDEEDITNCFLSGALEGLRIAKEKGCRTAILKSKSPSCGCGLIYDGTFRGILTKGDGVFTSILKENGIEVTNENNL